MKSKGLVDGRSRTDELSQLRRETGRSTWRTTGTPTFTDPVDEQRSVSMDGTFPALQSEVDAPSSFLQLYAHQRPPLFCCDTADMQVRQCPLVLTVSEPGLTCRSSVFSFRGSAYLRRLLADDNNSQLQAAGQTQSSSGGGVCDVLQGLTIDGQKLIPNVDSSFLGRQTAGEDSVDLEKEAG